MSLNRAALLVLLLGLAMPAAASTTAPEVVQRAAEVYVRDVAGAIAYRARMESRISSPVFNRHSVMDSWAIMHDGQLVHTRILSLRNDGKDAGRDEIQKQESRTNASYRDGKSFFKPPYDRRYMGDYGYEVETEGGQTTVSFKSPLKDEQHGSGTFTLDREHRVRKLVFRPNVLPKNVDRGSFTLERQPVPGGLFATRRLSLSYEGSMGLIKGGFELAQQYEDYRRFKSLDEALSANLPR